MKCKLSPGQAIAFGAYRVMAITNAQLVAIGMPQHIEIEHRPAGFAADAKTALGFRQALVFEDGGYLISDSRDEITIEIMGPVERVKIDRGFHPRPPAHRAKGRCPQD